MATAYARRMFSGGSIVTTVPLAMGASDGSFSLAASTNWPSGSSGNFVVVIDFGLSTQEKILCSALSGLAVTVASSGRGYDGTTAVSHSAGASAQVVHCAQDDDEANQVVSAVLGQASAAKGDILAMLSAAGPNTLTRIPIGTAPQLLGVAAGLPAWTYPALTTASGSLPSPVTLTGSSATTKIMDTASLAAGTWLITFGCTFNYPTSAAGILEFQAIVDTATATFSGNTSQGFQGVVSTENDEAALSLTFIAVVTVAGTIKFTCFNNSASNAFAIAATQVESYANATAYTALRIA